jgi:hypothetical protein
MAQDLASIFGTEKDKVNCPFFFKIGACRHGDKCSRLHHRPSASQSLLLPHMYQNPLAGLTAEAAAALDQAEVQQEFEDFYEVCLQKECRRCCEGKVFLFFFFEKRERANPRASLCSHTHTLSRSHTGRAGRDEEVWGC